MGYQALLFCADERLARVVSQIFTELEFNIELVNEPFSAVKKLMAQHYDAIVVDCENEQNASLIFKSARNSATNQNSLALALVEGQAGVAKAYRIGANLVLTKPINVEQAKGTLRVARGLLRKNADAAAKAPSSAPPATPVSATTASTARECAFVAPSIDENKAPFAASREKSASREESVPASESTPATPVPEFETAPSAAALAKAEEAAPALPELKAETAVMGESRAKPVAPAAASKSAPAPTVQEHKPAVTFANLQGAAAAPARAKEAPAAARAKEAGTELFETTATKPAEVVGPPTFSAIGEDESEGSGGKKLLAIAAIAIVAFGLGYFAWTRFGDKSASPQAPNAVQNPLPAASSATPAAASTPSAAANQTGVPVQSSAVPAVTQASKPSAGTSSAPITKITAGSEDAKPEVITRTFEPAAIRVKAQSAGAKVQKQADESALPIPDPLAVGSSKDTNLASLVSSPAKLPAAPVSTLKISQGVSQGLLIRKVQPIYPPNARTMRLEGPVEMEAMIDREGKIKNLKVLKGQPVLAKAAVDAVRQWRYKPYYLDGEPVEIQTQITIVFKMPN